VPIHQKSFIYNMLRVLKCRSLCRHSPSGRRRIRVPAKEMFFSTFCSLVRSGIPPGLACGSRSVRLTAALSSANRILIFFARLFPCIFSSCAHSLSSTMDVHFSSSLATSRKLTRADSICSMISSVSTSGSGRFSRSVRFSSFIHRMSRLVLSRLIISS